MRNTQETLWLVYKWENLQPLSFYPSAQQAKISTGFSFWGMDVEAEALRARCLMLRLHLRSCENRMLARVDVLPVISDMPMFVGCNLRQLAHMQ